MKGSSNTGSRGCHLRCVCFSSVNFKCFEGPPPTTTSASTCFDSQKQLYLISLHFLFSHARQLTGSIHVLCMVICACSSPTFSSFPTSVLLAWNLMHTLLYFASLQMLCLDDPESHYFILSVLLNAMWHASMEDRQGTW